jgi:hypothetical protein
MNNFKVGDRLTINCYKHNGKIHRSWDEATVLDITDEYLVCANNKAKVTENDGRSYYTNEPAIIFFYKNKWYNVIAQLKSHGLFYYCNIATPYVIDENIIKYIDYDLDLRVFPDGGFRVLDRNEYKYHKKLMHYSDDLDLVLRSELSKLIEEKRKNTGPFKKETIDKYYQKYKELQKK